MDDIVKKTQSTHVQFKGKVFITLILLNSLSLADPRTLNMAESPSEVTKSPFYGSWKDSYGTPPTQGHTTTDW